MLLTQHPIQTKSQPNVPQSAILSGATVASMNNALPEDGAAAPKHVTAILMYILILFLRQSLVHLLVNKKLL